MTMGQLVSFQRGDMDTIEIINKKLEELKTQQNQAMAQVNFLTGSINALELLKEDIIKELKK